MDEIKSEELKTIKISICQSCLDGIGEECHTPGCALYLHKVDLPINKDQYEIFDESALQSAREELARERERKSDMWLSGQLAKIREEADRLREALRIVADYFGVFGVKVGVRGPSFGGAGRACAEALGYSGDSYSNSKWGEPTSPAVPEKAECRWVWDDDGFWKTACGSSWFYDSGTPKENKQLYCHHCGKPIAEGGER